MLDEYLQIASIGQYSQSIVDMVMREVVEKSYRQTAKTISEDTAITMGHTSARNIVIKVSEKIKKMEEEKAKLRLQEIDNKVLLFQMFCMENYKAEKGLTPCETLELFSKYHIYEFLENTYEMLHTQDREYIIDSISTYIKKKK